VTYWTIFFFFFNNEIEKNRNYSDQPWLTCKIYDLDHETTITLYKANWKKLWNLINKQSNIKGWNWKKNQYKKNDTWVNLGKLAEFTTWVMKTR
jgi:hypothetical protein